MKAVESATLEVDIVKMTYKDELKRGNEMMLPSRKLEAARPLQTRPKSSKRQRVMNPLKPQSL